MKSTEEVGDFEKIADKQALKEQLQDIDEGIGYSSDKILARRYGLHRKTIWNWAKDPSNPFPHPKKISPNTTRWLNEEILAFEKDALSNEFRRV